MLVLANQPFRKNNLHRYALSNEQVSPHVPNPYNLVFKSGNNVRTQFACPVDDQIILDAFGAYIMSDAKLTPCMAEVRRFLSKYIQINHMKFKERNNIELRSILNAVESIKSARRVFPSETPSLVDDHISMTMMRQTNTGFRSVLANQQTISTALESFQNVFTNTMAQVRQENSTNLQAVLVNAAGEAAAQRDNSRAEAAAQRESNERMIKTIVQGQKASMKILAKSLKPRRSKSMRRLSVSTTSSGSTGSSPSSSSSGRASVGSMGSATSMVSVASGSGGRVAQGSTKTGTSVAFGSAEDAVSHASRLESPPDEDKKPVAKVTERKVKFMSPSVTPKANTFASPSEGSLTSPSDVESPHFAPRVTRAMTERKATTTTQAFSGTPSTKSRVLFPKTPASSQTVATGSDKIARVLKPGMSFPLNKDGITLCGNCTRAWNNRCQFCKKHAPLFEEYTMLLDESLLVMDEGSDDEVKA